MRLSLAPINPTVGDLAGNADLCRSAIRTARDAGSDLVILPELVISGYPPMDLLWCEGFVEAAMDAAVSLADAAGDIVVIVGTPWRDRDGVRNSLLALRQSAVAERYDKRLLPTYDVFDEDRYFTPGDRAVVVEVAGVRVGLAICEDLWRGDDAGVSLRYRGRPDPMNELARAGAEVVVSPSATPFVLGKAAAQHVLLRHHAQTHGFMVASVNQFGANDELIFDGHTAVYQPADAEARLIAAGAPFAGSMLTVDLASADRAPDAEPYASVEPEELLWKALVLGVRDYARKTGFERAIVALSGGIDSALTATLAVAALGPDRVLGVGMPGRFSSVGSIEDAQALAERLGVRSEIIPLEPLHRTAEFTLAPIYRALAAAPEPGVAEENVQSRLRGLILMALSNKLNLLPLSTGNKSELAVGYCTLYGDMNGGLAVLSDVFKTQIYRLARWINEHAESVGFGVPPIPESTIDKPPSAELRPDQHDQQTLPPYEVLDEIIARAVEHRESPATIERETGFDAATVVRVVRMIDRAEYKRRQAAIGLKVTSVAFGTGRRYPIAQRWIPPADPG